MSKEINNLLHLVTSVCEADSGIDDYINTERSCDVRITLELLIAENKESEKLYEMFEQENRGYIEYIENQDAENKQLKAEVDLLKTALKDMVNVNKRLKIFQDGGK